MLIGLRKGMSEHTCLTRLVIRSMSEAASSADFAAQDRMLLSIAGTNRVCTDMGITCIDAARLPMAALFTKILSSSSS